jgi:hypothetical protein
MCQRVLKLGFLCFLTVPLAAQTLILPPGPVAPGSAVPVTVINTSGSPIAFAGTEFVLLRPTGEVADPRFVYQGDALSILMPGQSASLGYQVPSPLLGAPGSFVLLFIHGGRAAARLDVGAPAPSFPALHGFPTRVNDTFRTHFTGFGTASPATLDLFNLSSAPFSFGQGDRIDLFTPGGTVAVATAGLSGVAVPAGGRTIVPLPVTGLSSGPYTARVMWTDPAAGLQVRTFGIREPASADLRLPAGHVVPFGGSLEAYLALSGIAVGSPASPVFALLVGVNPGSTPLPNGVQAPLSAGDPLVLASFSGLGGLLIGNTGTATSVVPCFCPIYNGTFDSGSILLVHPNVPALSGVSVRVAGVVIESLTGLWGASQPEIVTLQ